MEQTRIELGDGIAAVFTPDAEDLQLLAPRVQVAVPVIQLQRWAKRQLRERMFDAPAPATPETAKG